MITAWRIVKAKHSANAFDGEGARRYGGRWNSIGIPMIYTSDYLATAALELMVNMIDYFAVFQKYVYITAEIPTEYISKINTKKLPSNWQESLPPKSTQALGDAWILKADSAVLSVPSVIIPQHNTYLINPHHPDFSNIKIGKPRPFKFDQRFIKS